MFRFFCRPIGQVVFFLAAVAAALAPAGLRADDWPPVEINPATAKIEAALSDSTTLEFIETPLADVVDYLKDLHGIEMQIDHRCLGDIGIGSDTPVTRNLKGITLRSALSLMLRELDLTYLIRDEVLLITTPEEVESELYLEIYHIAPLLDDENNAEKLIDILTSAIGGDSDGPKRSMSTFRGLLVLKGTYHDHQQVRGLLGTMATALEVVPPKPKIARGKPRPMGGRCVAKMVDGKVRFDLHVNAPRTAPVDPFAAPADPFGGGAADPFAGGGDPFGGGAAADDPFAEPMPAVGAEDSFDPFAD